MCCVVRVPEVFSILKNPDESYTAIKKIVVALVCQKCHSLWIDYSRCEESDLLTQVFMDSIFWDWNKFVSGCARANLKKYIRNYSYGARNINSTLQKMINSVGSPTILLNRKTEYDKVIPFNLRYFDQSLKSGLQSDAANELDTTLLLEYVDKCLDRIGKTMTSDAMKALGTVVGETVINASEHSTLKARYLIGYFEDQSAESCIEKRSMLNLVILNYGQSIYETFKEPMSKEAVNSKCLAQMQELSLKYIKKRLFSDVEFRESTLWTLYALQQGVSIIPDSNRGNGTIQFIKEFFNLRESDENNESRMFILSGDTTIEFDGTYKVVDHIDEEGNKMGVLAFNKQGILSKKPDKRFVRYSKNFFPGTAIYARIALNSINTKENDNRLRKISDN